MHFKKYSSIENSYRGKYLNYILDQGHSGGDDWLITEKIHGSNFQLAVDTTGVQAGKRTSLLGDTDNFFNFQSILDKYSEGAKKIFSAVEKENLLQISIFGELYGGIYPHDDVKNIPATQVQKGIYYCRHNDFMVFDIYIQVMYNDEPKGYWLPYDVVQLLCTTNGLMSLDILFKGTLEDALKYSNQFESTIYKYHNLPQIEDNICEGIVIKPNVPRHLFNGERIVIKNKNEVWSEKARTKKIPKIEWTLSDEASNVIATLSLFVTENRLKNLISKIGEITQKDFGKLMSGMITDIMEEFLKDNKEEYMLLTKVDQKQVSKKLNGLTATLIRTNFLNIIDGSY